MTGISRIVVLGMHESGAPLVTLLIASMGANAGERDRSAAPGGSGDTWTNAAVRELNEGLLTQLGSSWLDRGPLLLDQLPQADLRRFQEQAAAIVASLESPGPCVLHDPCMPLVFELWKPVLGGTACVLVHRAPGVVARSLSLRHGLPLPDCLALWERYNRASLAASASLPRSLVTLEQVLQNPRRVAVTLHRQFEALGIKGLRVPPADAFHALASAGLPEVALTPEQHGLACALEDGSALDEPAFWATPAAAEADGSKRQPPALKDDPAAAAPAGGSALFEIRLLRQREKVRALQAEIAELRRVAERHPSRNRSVVPVRGRQPEQPPGGRHETGTDVDISGTARYRVDRTLTPSRSNGVFVIGCPRSGTSVFAWALAQHPGFWTSEESDYLLDLFGWGRLHRAYRQALRRADRGWLNQERVTFPEFSGTLGLGVEALFDSRSGGARWVDATPGYTLMTEELLRMFPGASLLHIVRDGRAVVNSMISSGFDIDWATDFATACRAWVHYATLGHRAARRHPQRVLEVRHHELTADPESELARVFDFLGEEPCTRSVRLVATGRINSSYGNVRPRDIRLAKDPATAPRHPWEAWTSRQLRIFRRIAGKTMSALGFSA